MHSQTKRASAARHQPHTHSFMRLHRSTSSYPESHGSTPRRFRSRQPTDHQRLTGHTQPRHDTSHTKYPTPASHIPPDPQAASPAMAAARTRRRRDRDRDRDCIVAITLLLLVLAAAASAAGAAAAATAAACAPPAAFQLPRRFPCRRQQQQQHHHHHHHALRAMPTSSSSDNAGESPLGKKPKPGPAASFLRLLARPPQQPPPPQALPQVQIRPMRRGRDDISRCVFLCF